MPPATASTASTASPTDSTGNQINLAVEGMHCAGCASKVESVLSSLPTVNSATVSLLTASAMVAGTDLNPDEIIAAVKSKGFDAAIKTGTQRESVAEQRTAIESRQHQSAQAWKRRLIVGLSAWLPMAFLHWGGTLLGISAQDAHAITGPWVWLNVALAAIVLIYVGSAFYTSAYKAARNRTTNMDTLVAIGATAAFSLSFYTVIMMLLHHWGTIPEFPQQPLYFTEAGGLLTLISLGHYLEARTTAAASSAVRELLALQPDDVTRITSIENENSGTVVPSADINPEDLMLVRPGERIAVDGIITHGKSTLDEAVVTGESLPVDRNIDEPVIAGSMNLTGRLIVRATTSGRDTTIARIADLVRSAQSSKADIQRLADKVCAIFVPAVLGIALITFLGWSLGVMLFGGTVDWVNPIVYATTVLVISCPCALGLAAPTAVMVGSGAASRRGILVKSARTVEHVASLRTILLDKTGTLTTGTPVVVNVTPTSDRWNNETILRYASTLAQNSTHPLAQAIVTEANRLDINQSEIQNFHEEAGRGITATINDAQIELISRKAAEASHPSITENPTNQEFNDCTSSVLIVSGQVLAEIFFRDEIRPEAKEIIASLQARGIRPLIVTGDRQLVADSLAQRIGIPTQDVHAELSPEQKVAVVRSEAQAVTTGLIAMVGDGINDAAALAQAGAEGGVGIAMGAGTNIAIESADVVITGDDLHAILHLCEISQKSLRTIKQNLFLSFIYNTLAIPAAALGLLGLQGPLIAAAAMGISDFCVVGNSLRLKWHLSRK